MRNLILLAGLFGLGLLSAVVPSAATDQSTAVKLCGQNPNCGLIRGTGGVGLWVKTSGGGTNEIWCPDNGPCECISCTPPARKQPHLGYLIKSPFNATESLASSGGSEAPFMATPSAPSGGGGSGGANPPPPIIY